MLWRQPPQGEWLLGFRFVARGMRFAVTDFARGFSSSFYVDEVKQVGCHGLPPISCIW